MASAQKRAARVVAFFGGPTVCLHRTERALRFTLFAALAMWLSATTDSNLFPLLTTLPLRFLTGFMFCIISSLGAPLLVSIPVTCAVLFLSMMIGYASASAVLLVAYYSVPAAYVVLVLLGAWCITLRTGPASAFTSFGILVLLYKVALVFFDAYPYMITGVYVHLSPHDVRALLAKQGTELDVLKETVKEWLLYPILTFVDLQFPALNATCYSNGTAVWHWPIEFPPDVASAAAANVNPSVYGLTLNAILSPQGLDIGIDGGPWLIGFMWGGNARFSEILASLVNTCIAIGVYTLSVLCPPQRRFTTLVSRKLLAGACALIKRSYARGADARDGSGKASGDARVGTNPAFNARDVAAGAAHGRKEDVPMAIMSKGAKSASKFVPIDEAPLMAMAHTLSAGERHAAKAAMEPYLYPGPATAANGQLDRIRTSLLCAVWSMKSELCDGDGGIRWEEAVERNAEKNVAPLTSIHAPHDTVIEAGGAMDRTMNGRHASADRAGADDKQQRPSQTDADGKETVGDEVQQGEHPHVPARDACSRRSAWIVDVAGVLEQLARLEPSLSGRRAYLSSRERLTESLDRLAKSAPGKEDDPIVGELLDACEGMGTYYTLLHTQTFPGFLVTARAMLVPATSVLERLASTLWSVRVLFQPHRWRGEDAFFRNPETQWEIKAVLGLALIVALPMWSTAYRTWTLGAPVSDDTSALTPTVLVEVESTTKVTPWVILGFLATFFLTHEGSGHRVVFFTIGNVVGAFSGWCALTAIDSEKHPGLSLLWCLVVIFAVVWLCVSPQNPLVAWHPELAYAAQVIAYGQVYIALDTITGGGTRDYLFRSRVLGMISGAALAFILSNVPPRVSADAHARRLLARAYASASSVLPPLDGSALSSEHVERALADARDCRAQALRLFEEGTMRQKHVIFGRVDMRLAAIIPLIDEYIHIVSAFVRDGSPGISPRVHASAEMYAVFDATAALVRCPAISILERLRTRRYHDITSNCTVAFRAAEVRWKAAFDAACFAMLREEEDIAHPHPSAPHDVVAHEHVVASPSGQGPGDAELGSGRGTSKHGQDVRNAPETATRAEGGKKDGAKFATDAHDHPSHDASAPLGVAAAHLSPPPRHVHLSAKVVVPARALLRIALAIHCELATDGVSEASAAYKVAAGAHMEHGPVRPSWTDFVPQ